MAWKRMTLALLVALSLALTGCGPLVEDGEKALNIYATFYPIYALTDALMTDVPNIDLHCLVQPQDGCLRGYSLSDWDLYLLASSDAVLCGGRGLESFESLLFQWGEKGPAVSAALYNLELYEGKAGSDREDSHLGGPNPHLYLSVDGAKAMLSSISSTLMTLDPGYTDRYSTNAAEAVKAMDSLSETIRAESAGIHGQRVILMNEAFIYTANDLGMEVAEWIDRESGEGLYDDGFFEKLDASGAQVVLIEKQAPAALVSALREAGYSVALLDTLSTHHEGEGFDIYTEVLLNNARAVIRAFEETDR